MHLDDLEGEQRARKERRARFSPTGNKGMARKEIGGRYRQERTQERRLEMEADRKRIEEGGRSKGEPETKTGKETRDEVWKGVIRGRSKGKQKSRKERQRGKEVGAGERGTSREEDRR